MDFHMETVAIFQKPVESHNAVLSHSDQVHHDVQPEMAKAPEAVQSQVFDLTKLSYELQQGYRVYIELLSDSNRNVTWPFLEPVDAEAQGLWDYHERVKQPMSFSKSKCSNWVNITISDFTCLKFLDCFWWSVKSLV